MATIHNLRKAVTGEDLWLHLSAHTVNGNALVLEDGCGGTEALTLRALDRLLRSGGVPAVSFVFLSNCRSEALAAAFYKAGVRHIVYTDQAVSDQSASEFAKSFYLALACKRSLKVAFNMARAELQAMLPENVSCGFHLHSAHDFTLEVKPPESSDSLMGRWQAETHLLSKASLPGQVEDFVGREETILSVLQHLSQRRLVVLHCEKSLGLSATLLEIARYVSAPGRRFQNHCHVGSIQPLQRGLLVVDNAERELSKLEILRSNLESPDFYLLLGLRAPRWHLLQDLVKPVHVLLPPLSLLESATLFVQRCHRPLSLSDVLPSSSDSRPLPKERAKQLLKPLMSLFGGDPRQIRQAAGRVTPNLSALRGDLEQLLAKSGRSWAFLESLEELDSDIESSTFKIYIHTGDILM